jgi:hypothetical protein
VRSSGRVTFHKPRISGNLGSIHSVVNRKECEMNLTPFFFLPFALFGTVSERKE